MSFNIKWSLKAKRFDNRFASKDGNTNSGRSLGVQEHVRGQLQYMSWFMYTWIKIIHEHTIKSYDKNHSVSFRLRKHFKCVKMSFLHPFRIQKKEQCTPIIYLIIFIRRAIWSLFTDILEASNQMMLYEINEIPLNELQRGAHLPRIFEV